MARLFRVEDLISQDANETARALRDLANALEAGEMTVQEIEKELKNIQV